MSAGSRPDPRPPTRRAGFRAAAGRAAVIAACLGLSACQEDSGPRPQVCANLTVQLGFPTCPYHPVLKFDAACSRDDHTPSDALMARWDFENDGTWDTPFRPAWFKQAYRMPEILTGHEWVARCQVMDSDSLSTIDIVTLPLPADLPRPPDILLGNLIVETDDQPEGADTLHVGESFGLSVFDSCIADYDYGPYTVEYRQNGQLIYTQHGRCGPWDPIFCTGFGKLGFTIQEPGHYTFTITANPDSALFETNYANNRATAEVVVIP